MGDVIDSLFLFLDDINIVFCYNLFFNAHLTAVDLNFSKKRLNSKTRLLSTPLWNEECKRIYEQRLQAE